MPKITRRINHPTDRVYGEVARPLFAGDLQVVTLPESKRGAIDSILESADHFFSDSSPDDNSSLQIKSPPQPPSYNTALSSSGWAEQTEIKAGSEKLNPKQKKWELGEDETSVVKRYETLSRNRRLRHDWDSLDSLSEESSPIDKPRIDRQMGDLSRPVTPDNFSPREVSLAPTGSTFDPSEYFKVPSRNISDVGQREHYTVEKTITSTNSVKSTISEDLSRDDKDRGAKLRYLQERLDKQMGLYKV